jgi:hypothetical protein
LDLLEYRATLIGKAALKIGISATAQDLSAQGKKVNDPRLKARASKASG